jgi:aspartate carbamoyltransferase catalytic subunit
MALANRSLVAINDFGKDEWLEVLDEATVIKQSGLTSRSDVLKGRIVATLFFEASTRTRMSFQAAIQRLGGDVIGFSSASMTSVKKGESLEDTIRMVNGYADAIVIRHPEIGAASRALAVSDVPVINAGDGANEHPTQTLLDLFSIQETQGKLDNLHIGFGGDNRYSRTTHSLVKALAAFDNNTMEFISPDELTLPRELREFLQNNSVQFSETDQLEMVLDDLDTLYLPRIQKERFEDQAVFEKVKNVYRFGQAHLDMTKENFRLFSPLPRIDEIDTAIDDDPKSYYFKQAANGVPVRMALLQKILG